MVDGFDSFSIAQFSSMICSVSSLGLDVSFFDFE